MEVPRVMLLLDRFHPSSSIFSTSATFAPAGVIYQSRFINGHLFLWKQRMLSQLPPKCRHFAPRCAFYGNIDPGWESAIVFTRARCSILVASGWMLSNLPFNTCRTLPTWNRSQNAWGSSSSFDRHNFDSAKSDTVTEIFFEHLPGVNLDFYQSS